MQDYEIDEILYRIIDGYLDYYGNKIKDPTYKELKAGKFKYAEVMRDCYDTISDKDLYILLCENNRWDASKQEELDKLPKQIENLKLKYFENYIQIANRNKHKIGLDMAVRLHNKLYKERNIYMDYTPEGIASTAMWTVMIDLIYSGPRKMAALNFYHKNAVLEEQIRDVALSAEWSGYNCMKNPFGKPAIELTQYQRQLLNWTSVYRNIKSHPDCPHDKIIADHDAFDGWLIQQNRKTNAERKQKSRDEGINPNANVVFINSKTQDDAREIHELNDSGGKQKIQSMIGQLNKSDKSLNEGEFNYYKNQMNKKG